MKVLVTGGAGFIASHIVDELVRKKHKVVVLDNLSTGRKANVNTQAVFYKADIRSPQIRNIFSKEKPQAVFHYAAQIDIRRSVKDPAEDASVNIEGSLNVLENCRSFRVGKIIFASSGGAIYGDAETIPTAEGSSVVPGSPYAIAKASVEQYLQYYRSVFQLPFAVLRFANVYGPRQNSKGEAGVVAIFADAMLQGKRPVIFGSGSQTRDFLYVQDAVDASIAVLGKGVEGVFNVGTGKETSVNEIFKQLKILIGFPEKEVRAEAKKGEVQRSCLDAEKIRKVLRWKPAYTLKQGLKKTVESFQ